jgi:hypothetical protein
MAYAQTGTYKNTQISVVGGTGGSSHITEEDVELLYELLKS